MAIEQEDQVEQEDNLGSGMTYQQERLLSEAKDSWSRGFRIPTTLYAQMAMTGLDVIALEEKYFKDN
jgi:hypothetical protein